MGVFGSKTSTIPCHHVVLEILGQHHGIVRSAHITD